ncbi:MAG: cyclic nucleotide-binding domain-containing protein [Phormidium tanganyikae FI6-MK23]|nr:cyclic nucleotide-binding domain-containing protein [Phormidium tanganyikae FI6-MK23]
MKPASVKKHENRLFLNLISGGTMGILTVITSVSFGAVIFSGGFSDVLPWGIGVLLFSAAVINTIASSFSSYPSVVATLSDNSIPVLSLVARQIADLMPNATVEEKLLTLSATIVLNSIVGGAILMALGRFKLGGLIRFIPYPVVGGFIASTGLLLVEGAFQSLSGVDYDHLTLSVFLQPSVLFQWLPAVFFALAMYVLPKSIQHFLLLPGIIAASIALFYAGLALTGTSIAQADAQQLLLGAMPAGGLFQFNTIPAVIHADWSVVSKQVPTLAALWLIDSIALLLNANGIELLVKRDFDLNRELKIAGAASIVSGLGGGAGGFSSLNETALVKQLGGTSRSVGRIIAVMCFAIAFGSAESLAYFPKFVLVGLPLLYGMEPLYEWIYQAWFKFSRSDYAIILLIVAVTATAGYLQGIAVGLMAAIVLFVINYSRLAVTKRVSSGSYYHSNVLRAPEETDILQAEGEQVLVLELQGLIFFGTANKLINQIRDRLAHTAKVKFVILDFRLVSGLDASAVLSFAKLEQLANQKQLHLLFTQLSKEAKERLSQGDCLDEFNPLCHRFDDLDRGLEWCEQQILQTQPLAQLEPDPESPDRALNRYLKSVFLDPAQVDRLMSLLKTCSLQPGEYLFSQGDPFDGLYFVGSGQVSVVLELGQGQTKRIRTYTIGNTIGEMGLYRQAVRMASVVADKPSTVYFLSSEAFEQIEASDSLLAANVHRFIVNLLAERLEHREQELKNLLQSS